MAGCLFGVGAGPGDPSLLTLKAVETIRNCDVIAAADTGESVALSIVRDYLSGKEIVKYPAPMTRDRMTLSAAHKNAADDLCNRLSLGQNIAFVTLGDPSVYSTYIYIDRLVRERGFDAKMIPGVTSFCASAAALGDSLCDEAVPLHIIPASYDELETALELSGTKVLMKSGKQLGAVIKLLMEKGLDKNAAIVSCVGMENEQICTDLKEMKLPAGYFSTIIVKEN